MVSVAAPKLWSLELLTRSNKNKLSLKTFTFSSINWQLYIFRVFSQYFRNSQFSCPHLLIGFLNFIIII